MARLMESVYPSQNSGRIDMDLDLESGDEVYFSPTATQWDHSEYHTIDTYDSVTGIFTITGTFAFYHFGSEDTATDYQGLDMRGEVAILNRNVKVMGTDEDGWGGQIITTDTIDADGTIALGSIVLENVEVRNCSQRDTQRAAIRFEDSFGSYSRLRGVSVHSGLGFGIHITNAKNVEIYDSTVVRQRQIGLVMDWTRNVTVDGIFVSDINYRLPDALDGNNDVEACVAFCSYGNIHTGTKCYETSIINSIASGCPRVGFTAPGFTCGETGNTKFYNNVAHSVQGNGAIIYPDPALSTSKVCYEGSHFSAYKVTEQGLSTYFDTAEMRFHDMVFVDNTLGMTLQIGEERELATMKLYDSFIFGESGGNLADDCPNQNDCYCEDKSGFQFFSHNRGVKAIHPWHENRPFYRIEHPSGWGGYGLITNVAFKNFLSKATSCGAIQTVFSNQIYASDIIPIHKFDSCTWEDVVDNALVRILAPNVEWARVEDCGQFTCSGPLNVVLRLSNANFEGQSPVNTNAYSTITTALVTDTTYYNNCVYKSEWNGW